MQVCPLQLVAVEEAATAGGVSASPHCTVRLQGELHGTMMDHAKEVATLKQALKRAEKLAEERLHQLQQEQGAHSHLRREAEQKVGRCQQLRHQVRHGQDRDSLHAVSQHRLASPCCPQC